MVDCDRKNAGCNGGLMQDAVKWAARDGEPDYDGYDPYSAARHTCHAFDNAFRGPDSHIDLTGCDDVKGDSKTFPDGSTDDIKKALLTYGTLIMAVGVDSDF